MFKNIICMVLLVTVSAAAVLKDIVIGDQSEYLDYIHKPPLNESDKSSIPLPKSKGCPDNIVLGESKVIDLQKSNTSLSMDQTYQPYVVSDTKIEPNIREPYTTITGDFSSYNIHKPTLEHWKKLGVPAPMTGIDEKDTGSMKSDPNISKLVSDFFAMVRQNPIIVHGVLGDPLKPVHLLWKNSIEEPSSYKKTSLNNDQLSGLDVISTKDDADYKTRALLERISESLEEITRALGGPLKPVSVPVHSEDPYYDLMKVKPTLFNTLLSGLDKISTKDGADHETRTLERIAESLERSSLPSGITNVYI